MIDPDISTADALSLLTRAETDPNALDRRRFLQLIGMGASVGLLGGGMGSLLDGVGATPDAWAAGPVGATDGIVVVLGMYGGNNGLNTVVPVDDGRYHDMHGPLAFRADEVLPLGAGAGLHPNLTTLHRFWDDGQLAIVEGIGYPNPDLSHFTSMAYWMAGTTGGVPSSGWLGRWLDGHLGGAKDLYAAAAVGSGLPLHLRGERQRGTVVAPGRAGFGADTDDKSMRQYAAIRAMRSTVDGPWSAAVGDAFADSLDLAATLADVIPDDDALPDTDIVAQLEVAARLINADLGFRVLTTGFGDFDSHAGEPSQHGSRMRELDDAVARFYAVLDPAWASRVTIMTFSEFGRTPWSNDGAGTDHGTSAPHFVIGHNVAGGWFGERPSLGGLDRWDRMDHHVDFRSYYASIIDGWLGGGSSTVLGGEFEDLGLFAAGPGDDTGGGTPPGSGGGGGLAGFVPMSPIRLVDTRTGLGGTHRPMRRGETMSVEVVGRHGIPSSGVSAVIANITAVQATEQTYFTVFPGSSARPGTSNLNAGPGRPVPNLVVMGVGPDGCIEVYNAEGSAHCLVDVFGYATAAGGDGFTPVEPRRLVDSRDGLGIAPRAIGGNQPQEIQVAGRAGVPASGATAVVMNLTAVRASSPGFMRSTPSGRPTADTSNVNFGTGDVVPNLVVCQLGDDGRVTLDASGTGTHVVADVFGYFSESGARLRPVAPVRVLDTRDGTGSERTPVGPGRSVTVPIGGTNGVPTTAVAVVVNVTATRASTRSFLSVWPAGENAPGTSNLNVEPGRVSANLVICRLGVDGALTIANPEGHCDVIADVTGYYV